MKLNGVDQEIIDKMNQKFQVSDAYTQAMNYTQGLLEKVNSGKTSYTEQLNQLTQNYANKPKFQYDMNTDTLFQNALSSAMGQGKNAMQDAIGQASALTGGYASSSAQAVGNQAYNNFIKGAYDNLPAFYQMSLDAYNSEDQRMLNQINLIKDADATEYGRLRDAYALNKDKADTLYNREYQTFNDDRSHATQMASLQNTDWWKKTEYDRAVEEARLQREFEAEQNRLAREQSASQFREEMDYKYTSSGYKKDTSGKYVQAQTTPTYKTPTSNMYQTALKKYNEGGQAELDKYLETLPDYDVVALDDYVTKNGQLPLAQRTFTKTKDTRNAGFLGFTDKNNSGVDHNDIVKDQYGNTYKISDLKDLGKDFQLQLTKLAKGKSYTKK